MYTCIPVLQYLSHMKETCRISTTCSISTVGTRLSLVRRNSLPVLTMTKLNIMIACAVVEARSIETLDA